MHVRLFVVVVVVVVSYKADQNGEENARKSLTAAAATAAASTTLTGKSDLTQSAASFDAIQLELPTPGRVSRATLVALTSRRALLSTWLS